MPSSRFQSTSTTALLTRALGKLAEVSPANPRVYSGLRASVQPANHSIGCASRLVPEQLDLGVQRVRLALECDRQTRSRRRIDQPPTDDGETDRPPIGAAFVAGLAHGNQRQAGPD